mgnify:CR=1 FL=1
MILSSTKANLIPVKNTLTSAENTLTPGKTNLSLPENTLSSAKNSLFLAVYSLFLAVYRLFLAMYRLFLGKNTLDLAFARLSLWLIFLHLGKNRLFLTHFAVILLEIFRRVCQKEEVFAVLVCSPLSFAVAFAANFPIAQFQQQESTTMASRISRKPDELSAQCVQAGVGITAAGATWPPSAPGAADVTSAGTSLESSLQTIATVEAQLKGLRQTLETDTDYARGLMEKVDQATDLLYGPDGPEKINFGLDPKKTTRTPSGTPEQVVIGAFADGTQPASLFVDFDSVDAAAYEVQWFSDAPLTQLVGSATVTNSEIEIPGLTRGNQYWIRVRAVRAGQPGPWSDQATRIAGI